MRRLFVGLSVAVMVLALSMGALTQSGSGEAQVEEVIFTEVPDRAAIRMLEAGELDIYAFSMTDVELFKRVAAHPDLTYVVNFGSYYELTFNPVGPTFPGTGAFNPFYFPKIREAMNWLINRDYIVGEFMGGLAVPKYTVLNAAFPDAGERYPDIIAAIEKWYAYNPEKAKAIITEEMWRAGAVLQGGKWYYGGQPVTIIFLIRTEDERRLIGDYIATLLEDIGFTVDRQYKTFRGAAACWRDSDPATGCFHIYTGGWVTTLIDRDQGGNFDFFYTPRGRPYPLWRAYTPDPEFDAVADRLARNDYNTMEERRALFTMALELSMEDSVRVWLVDRQGFTPFRANVAVAADLAGGISGSHVWAFSINFVDIEGREGRTMRIAMPSLLVEPWNPIAGSSNIYDMMPIRGTSENSHLVDPQNGLLWPLHFERAEVCIQEGLPVFKTLDWVDLTFVPEIRVPADAWCDWDAANQRFITVGEKYPQGLTAKRKSVVYYPASLYDVSLHDGSKISIADFVLRMILTFDRSKPESAIYDEATVPAFESFMKDFRGVRIVSVNPLVIETYSDLYYLDAEWNVVDWFPYYDQGPGFWHTLALGIMAEANKELAFSSDKADVLEIDWMDYTKGPSLPILAKYLDQALETGYIPYAPTLGRYLTVNDAKARYANLKAWYEWTGHFWVASGPFYLEEVRPVEKIIVLKRFPAWWGIWAIPCEVKCAIAYKKCLEKAGIDKYEIALCASCYAICGLRCLVPLGCLFGPLNKECKERGFHCVQYPSFCYDQYINTVDTLDLAHLPPSGADCFPSCF